MFNPNPKSEMLRSSKILSPINRTSFNRLQTEHRLTKILHKMIMLSPVVYRPMIPITLEIGWKELLNLRPAWAISESLSLKKRKTGGKESGKRKELWCGIEAPFKTRQRQTYCCEFTPCLHNNPASQGHILRPCLSKTIFKLCV